MNNRISASVLTALLFMLAACRQPEGQPQPNPVPMEVPEGESLWNAMSSEIDALNLQPLSPQGAEYIRAIRLLGQNKDAEALAIIRPLAEKGNAVAQNTLGMLYAQGKGVPQDDRQAVFWYQKAADTIPPAAFNLGGYYLYGMGGLPVQPEKTVKLWEKAIKDSKQPFATAMMDLGILYMNGADGVPPDQKRAVGLIERAAQAGLARAQDELARLYLDGVGKQQSDRQAFEWFSKAAAQNYAPAQTALGFMYFHGRGGAPQSRESARVLWLDAVKQKEAYAAQNMALYYNTQQPPDHTEARKWMQKSADWGNPDAVQWLAANPE